MKPLGLAVVLTGQEECVEQNEDDNDSVERLHFNQILNFIAKLYAPLILLALAELVLLLLLGVVAPSCSSAVLALIVLFLLFLFRFGGITGLLVLVVLERVLLLLHFLLLLESNLLLDLLLPALLLVEGITQVSELHSDHEIKDEVGAEEDAGEEEQVEDLRFLRVPNHVHHVRPALERDYLEDVEHRVQDVVEVESATRWISELSAGALNGLADIEQSALLVRLAKVLRLVWSEFLTPFMTFTNLCLASLLEVTAQELCGYGTKHDEHETEEDHNVDHDG